jgi:uncharacterized protein (TIGR02145 family)
MKALYVVALLAAASVSTVAVAQKAAGAGAKVGALAVDRQNGFAYGFAFDHATRAEAEARALEEVTKRGGNGTVVLVWSGEGCGAYRTIDPKDGNAYGWGVAATQAAAEAIADREVDKRARGKAASNHVWACNSKQPAKLKVMKDLSNENFRTVTLAGHTWTAENVNIDKFRNGDPIPKFANYDAFWKVSRLKKPASFCFASDPNCSKLGRLYNYYAITDPRGFAPEGWAVPTAAQWQGLIDAMGGKEGAVPRLRSADGWPADVTDPGEQTGFDALSTGYPNTPKPDGLGAFFWTSSVESDDGTHAYYNHALLQPSNDADQARVGNQGGEAALSVRLIAE